MPKDKVMVGSVGIGKGHRITVQSMTNTKTSDVSSTVSQIKSLEKNGCDIVRLAVPDMKSAKALPEIRKQVKVPLVADIHFDYRLALMSMPHVDKIRINPGNIGDHVDELVRGLKKYNIPVRIGVNSGSIEKEFLDKYARSAEAMIGSALKHAWLLENKGFHDIVLSLKASSVKETVEVNRLIRKKADYPLHIGVTEAGTLYSGTVKSSIGIGSLLLDGIGDTIRVSLTDDPVKEVRLAREILKSLGLIRGIEIISCPTCARTEIDIIPVVKEIEDYTRLIEKDLSIAIMGCAVNGPGEASHADFGVACGRKDALLFSKGKTIKKVPQERIIDSLKELIDDA